MESENVRYSLGALPLEIGDHILWIVVETNSKGIRERIQPTSILLQPLENVEMGISNSL